MSETLTVITPTIFEALARAQAKFPAIKTNKTAHVKSKKTGAEYDYNYCSLDAILDATRGPLAAEGLTLRHELTASNGVIWVDGILSHVSGAELRSGALPVPNWEHMQDLGSGLTYARRYTTNALLGICPEDDDDAARTPTGNPFRDEANARQERRDQQQPANGEPAQGRGAAKGRQASGKALPSSDTIVAAIGKIGNAAGLAKYLTERMGERPVAKARGGWSKIVAAAEARLKESTWSDEQKAAVEAVLKSIRVDLEVEKHPQPPVGDEKVDDLFTRTQRDAIAAEAPADMTALCAAWEASDELSADLPTFERILQYAGHEAERRCGKGLWKRDDPAVVELFTRLEQLRQQLAALTGKPATSNLF